MTQTIEAIYEKGYFRPLEQLKISLMENQIVTLAILTSEDSKNAETKPSDNDNRENK